MITDSKPIYFLSRRKSKLNLENNDEEIEPSITLWTHICHIYQQDR